MATILKSNGKRGDNLLEWDDATVIEHYKKAQKMVTGMERKHEAARAEKKGEAFFDIPVYLYILDVKVALENEVKYRELEWED